MTCGEIFEIIGEFYQLEDLVVQSLTFAYHSHTSTGRTVKVVRFNEGPLLRNWTCVDDKGESHPLYLDQLDLYRHVPVGTEMTVDVTCNSEFMLKHVRNMGQAIRDKYHWLPLSTPIYMVLDNAGGHGSTDAKRRFTRLLKRRFNVVCVWQVPNSPECNMLDLGAWAAIQKQVEERH